MADTKTIKAHCYAILGTLAECGPSPASQLYIALGMDMQAYEAVRDVLRGAGLITVADSCLISATAKGLSIGREINAILAKKEQTAV